MLKISWFWRDMNCTSIVRDTSHKQSCPQEYPQTSFLCCCLPLRIVAVSVVLMNRTNKWDRSSCLVHLAIIVIIASHSYSGRTWCCPKSLWLSFHWMKGCLFLSFNSTLHPSMVWEDVHACHTLGSVDESCAFCCNEISRSKNWLVFMQVLIFPLIEAIGLAF